MWKRPISRQSAEIIRRTRMVQVAETGTASCCIALEGGILSPPRPAPLS
ncbi:MAG: hypothetical protein R2697_00460 [Ilumatobacteraceae bacterium]